MSDNTNYYALLEVSEDASTDDIRQAYEQKRSGVPAHGRAAARLDAAWKVLGDAGSRRTYDLTRQYESQISEIQTRLPGCSDPEETRQYLLQAKMLYKKIINLNLLNLEALDNLFELTELLKAEREALAYLPELEKEAQMIKEKRAAAEIWHWIAEKYRKYHLTEPAIHAYCQVYQADAEQTEDVITYARLLYENKKDLKQAIQVLNNSVNRTQNKAIKVMYLSEILRAIRETGSTSYTRMESAIPEKINLLVFSSTDDNPAVAGLFPSMAECLEKRRLVPFHQLERIYLRCAVEDPELNHVFYSYQQIADAMEAGRYHEVINLFTEENWTDEMRKKIAHYIADDAAQIKESLLYLQEHAPLVWQGNSELQNLENLVDQNLSLSNELREIKNDRAISKYMREMIEMFLLGAVIPADELKDDFQVVKNAFFQREQPEKIQQTLERMELVYRRAFHLFSNRFFNGRSAREILASLPRRPFDAYPAYTVSQHGPVSSPGPAPDKINISVPGKTDGIRNTGEKPKLSARLKQAWKPLFAVAVAAIIMLGFIAGNVMAYLETQQEYEKDHDWWLTDEELEQKNEIEAACNEQSNVKIRYRQIRTTMSTSEYTGQYIYLIITDQRHERSYEIVTNYLGDTMKQEFEAEIDTLYQSDKTDMEKVEEYYRLASQYISKASPS